MNTMIYKNKGDWFRIFFAQNLLLILAFVVIFLSSCESDIKKVGGFSNNKLLPDLSVIELDGLMSDSSLVVAKLKAPIANKYSPKNQQQYYDFPKGIYIQRFDKVTRIGSSIKADYAKYYLDDRRWEFLNHVVGCNNQRDTLKTDQLIWDEKNSKIYSKDFIKFRKENKVFQSKGFESDANFKEIKFPDLRGTFDVAVSQ
ncbi:MAG: LPS export ABC transporter periplasmic protein LptC [Bacteroidota bacterium]|nr:LPS export ABC transporter periplasmic protein LptC [Bacteroidota bacterium]